MFSLFSFHFHVDVKIRELLEKFRQKESVSSRFIKLFESHGVHRNHIPGFFGHGLTIADISNEDLALKKLDDQLLKAASSLFNVRLEWLLCADNQVYSTHNFYKDPGRYKAWLNELVDSQCSERFIANLYLSTPKSWEYDAVLIIQERIGSLNDQEIYKYHLCSGWIHQYWKARVDLAACIAITLNANVYLKSSWVRGSLQQIAEGECLPHELEKLKLDRRKRGSIKKFDWQAEAWVFDPRDFVLGLAEGNFGQKNALARWLEYSKQGFMETGYSRDLPAPLFEEHLKRLK